MDMTVIAYNLSNDGLCFICVVKTYYRTLPQNALDPFNITVFLALYKGQFKYVKCIKKFHSSKNFTFYPFLIDPCK